MYRGKRLDARPFSSSQSRANRGMHTGCYNQWGREPQREPKGLGAVTKWREKGGRDKKNHFGSLRLQNFTIFGKNDQVHLICLA